MIRTAKLTETQVAILSHLVKRGHAMSARNIAFELKRRYIGVHTLRVLRDYEYIRFTDQGWLATDAGRLRVQDVV